MDFQFEHFYQFPTHFMVISQHKSFDRSGCRESTKHRVGKKIPRNSVNMWKNEFRIVLIDFTIPQTSARSVRERERTEKNNTNEATTAPEVLF